MLRTHQLYSPAMLQDTLEAGRVAADQALERLLPAETRHPTSIHKAMRHSVFAGGKRLRPILCREAGRMIAGSMPPAIDELGAALEMLHTYSLIHDDLPALDNDDLRRGKPTCHVVFGEATALLAGDALQSLGLELLATRPRGDAFAPRRADAVAIVASAIGLSGMAGGQALDLAATGAGASPEGQAK